MLTNSTNDIQTNKKDKQTIEKVERYPIPGLISFTDFTEQQIPRPESRRRKHIFRQYKGIP